MDANISIKVANLKSFGSEHQGFKCIKPFNIVLGRNNSGKSTLLDLLELVCGDVKSIDRKLWHEGNEPEILVTASLSESVLKKYFREGASRGEIPGSNHWEFARPLVGNRIEWLVTKLHDSPFRSIDDAGVKIFDQIARSTTREGYLNRIASSMPVPLSERTFFRIEAERNLEPEKSDGNPSFKGNGIGVVNTIQQFVNNADLPSELVEVNLLSDLNTIFSPDGKFTRITCQQLEHSHWEIYLEEENKGRIPLSQSGSGLKTVIIVLAHVLLLPVIHNKRLEEIVFGCEELENNLHPALIRRLCDYLFRKSESGAIFFLTTHSSIAIDQFSTEKDAQIIHVSKVDGKSFCNRAVTYVDNAGILDDLDVRASDILQSNCVIWVEGPTDRIFINRWIDLWSEGTLREGVQYRIVSYGGRLLSHLEATEPGQENGGVHLLSVNRNMVMVMDSDKRSAAADINATKKRIQAEVDSVEGSVWVTQGKEIENYLPVELIGTALDVEIAADLGQFQTIEDFLESVSEGLGIKYAQKKYLYAERMTPLISMENSKDILDLNERLEGICAYIRSCNGS